MLSNLPGVYFYYFYVPITAMTAEMLPTRIRDKFTALTITVLGACGLIFLFNLLTPYPLFFILFGFFSALLLYSLARTYFSRFMQTVPIILSLASYSLVYPSLNANLHLILTNAFTTLFSLSIMLVALWLFPLSFYYPLWRRALILLLHEIICDVERTSQDATSNLPRIQGHTQNLLQFAMSLPHYFPTYSILKINLLINRLHLSSRLLPPTIDSQDLESQLKSLLSAVTQQQPCPLPITQLTECTPLIQAWNRLCLNH
jgi:hypothetical protein